MRDLAIEKPLVFHDLPKAEKVRYVQALWNEISDNPEDLPAPESHLKLVNARLAEYQKNPSLAHPAFEILDRLKEKSE